MTRASFLISICREVLYVSPHREWRCLIRPDFDLALRQLGENLPTADGA